MITDPRSALAQRGSADDLEDYMPESCDDAPTLTTTTVGILVDGEHLGRLVRSDGIES